MSERSPASDPGEPLARLAQEVQALRGSVDAMAERLDSRLAELAQVQARLDASENSRRQLSEQMQHLLQLLSESRVELNSLRQAKS